MKHFCLSCIFAILAASDAPAEEKKKPISLPGMEVFAPGPRAAGDADSKLEKKSIDPLYEAVAEDLKQGKPLVIDVKVALCDNEHQMIVPVPKKLGNGDDPKSNLYWGAAFGLKTMLAKSPKWKMILRNEGDGDTVLEKVVFSREVEPNKEWRKLGVEGNFNAYLVGTAYRGEKIFNAMDSFFKSVYFDGPESILLPDGSRIEAAGAARIVGYMGHEGLMDFAYDFSKLLRSQKRKKGVFAFACLSKDYLAAALANENTHVLAMTKQLMAPEAYLALALVEGFLNAENGMQILDDVAKEYSKYQKISKKSALSIFTNEEAGDW